MQDNITNIFNKSLTINKENISRYIKEIINNYESSIFNSKDLFLKANEIDLKNNNAFPIDYKVIENIFNNINKEILCYGTILESKRDLDKKIIYGKEFLDIGNVVVITDGNFYVTLEMILRNILALNTTIFVNDGYMYGTNKLLIEILESVLEQFNVEKYLTQMIITSNLDEVLANYANIDLVVCIGNHELQVLITKKSKNKVLLSGYENFDLYIESINNKEFIDKILATNLNINLYINSNVNVLEGKGILVSSLDEAIAMINYNSSHYATAIFTNSKENASRFIKEIKSSIVTINTSPTIERIIDIKEKDLLLEKTIIYPLSFKFEVINKNEK